MGRYIVDLVCLEERLIVEVDGGQHSGQQKYDSERDEWLDDHARCIVHTPTEVLPICPVAHTAASGTAAFMPMTCARTNWKTH